METDKKMSDRRSMLSTAMSMMLALLEAERDALLSADALVVAEMALEKERLSGIISEHLAKLSIDEDGSADLINLAGKLNLLARENHVLIKQLYLQYHGIADLFKRATGQTPTYKRDGNISIGTDPTRTGKAFQGGGV